MHYQSETWLSDRGCRELWFRFGRLWGILRQRRFNRVFDTHNLVFEPEFDASRPSKKCRTLEHDTGSSPAKLCQRYLSRYTASQTLQIGVKFDTSRPSKMRRTLNPPQRSSTKGALPHDVTYCTSFTPLHSTHPVTSSVVEIAVESRPHHASSHAKAPLHQLFKTQFQEYIEFTSH
jgi:hypothetical protein